MAIIRISGYPGSGKSTLAKQLAKKLRYRHLSMGDLFRAMARKRGISVEQFYGTLVSKPNTERKLDERMIQYLSRHDNIIIDGRMVPFYPTPFKTINILLTVDHKEAARRLLQRPEGSKYTIQEMHERTRARVASDRIRYKNLYGLDNYLHPRYFNVVIDTTNRKAGSALHLALKQIKNTFQKHRR